jgi:hypothetical protein
MSPLRIELHSPYWLDPERLAAVLREAMHRAGYGSEVVRGLVVLHDSNVAQNTSEVYPPRDVGQPPNVGGVS